VSYAVTQRTREIGVRLALGQRPSDVLRVVLLETLRTVSAGAVPGVLCSVYAGRWLSSVVMVNADQAAAPWNAPHASFVCSFKVNSVAKLAARRFAVRELGRANRLRTMNERASRAVTLLLLRLTP